MNPPRKLLAIKLRSLGDTVLMTAPLAELHRVFPFTEIHVLVLSQWSPILEHHPAIHRLLTYDKPQNKAARAKALTRLALQLRKEKFDTVEEVIDYLNGGEEVDISDNESTAELEESMRYIKRFK